MIIQSTLCYIFGSISLTSILTRLHLITDPRTIGSGNIGFSNAYRAHKKLAIIIGLFDMFKGYISYIIFNHPYAGAIALLGNLYSIFGDSGKGIACLQGILIYHNPWHILIPIVWFILSKYTYPIIGSIAIMLYALYALPVIFIPLIVVIIIKHIPNIKRLRNKQEFRM